MVVAIIILSILFIFSILYNIVFTKGAVKVIASLEDEKKYNSQLEYYMDASNIEESFPCCLLLNLQFYADQSLTITDFSNYENSYIISYSVLSKNGPPAVYANELNKDGSIQMLIQNCYVNHYKDGGFYWEPM